MISPKLNNNSHYYNDNNDNNDNNNANNNNNNYYYYYSNDYDDNSNNYDYITFSKSFSWWLFFVNPLTPKISLVIVLTICHTILMMSIWRICYWIN